MMLLTLTSLPRRPIGFVIAKEHYPTLFDIIDDVLSAVLRSVSKVARAVNQALSPNGLNLVQANGPGAQQSVAHFHVHVLPRKRDEDLKLNWGAKPGDPETIAAFAEKIGSRL